MQSGVPGRHDAAGLGVKAARHASHDVVGTQAAGVILHLLLQIALVQTRQARRGNAVAFAFQAVTREAGVARAARAAAHGDDLAGRLKGAIGLARRRIAGGKGQSQKSDRQGAHPDPTPALRRRFRFGTPGRPMDWFWRS
ncbi:hypothetical protein D3C73_1107310 [compost metagenome]